MRKKFSTCFNSMRSNNEQEKITKNQPSMLEGWFSVRGDLPGGCPDTKFVVIEVAELGPFAPGFSA